LLFFWSTALAKLSVLLFYRRLVAGTYSNKIRYALWFGLVFVLSYTLVITVFVATACIPLETVWRLGDPTFQKPFKCQSLELQKVVILTGASSNVATDVYTVVLPTLLLLKLKITNRQRIALMAIFGLGIVCVTHFLAFER
jgi:hypothetical protein